MACIGHDCFWYWDSLVFAGKIDLLDLFINGRGKILTEETTDWWIDEILQKSMWSNFFDLIGIWWLAGKPNNHNPQNNRETHIRNWISVRHHLWPGFHPRSENYQNKVSLRSVLKTYGKYGFQVTENVLRYQVDKYAREKGANPERITPAQRDALMEEMITKKYPGKSLEYCISMNMNNIMPIRGRISFIESVIFHNFNSIIWYTEFKSWQP